MLSGIFVLDTDDYEAGENCMRKCLDCAFRLIRTKKCAEHVARVKELNNPHKILFNKPESKRIVGKPRRIREPHITRNLKRI